MSKPVKVFFVTNGITHYAKDLFIRLNDLPNVELVVVIPDKTSGAIGAGVFQSLEDQPFRVVKLEERPMWLFSHLFNFKGMTGLLLKEKPDVMIGLEVYLYPMMFNPILVLLIKFLRIKTIMKSIPFRMQLYQDALASALHSLNLSQGFVRVFKNALKNIRLRILHMTSAFFYRNLDAHVNYVEDGVRIYQSYGVKKDQVFVIYNAPDTDKLLKERKIAENQPLILPENAFRIIHVGRLVDWKRVDLLIQAVKDLKEKFHSVELLVIGYGPMEKEWKDFAETLGVSDRVKFLGGVYDPLLLAKYHLASAVYVLSGMGGLSINEAMCFGLPIVCSVGDGTEKHLVIEGHNGRYFKEGDGKDLTSKIDSLFSDPELCKQMGRNSIKIIEDKINIHTVVRGYRNAIEYVTQRNLDHV